MAELHFTKGGNNCNFNDQDREEEGNIELSLGLSLNGKFGVDPTTKINQQLKRSFSSISAIGETTRVDHAAATWNIHNPLSRTCSLPVEVEEESRRRRKELQMIRRRKAKRRQSEKQRISSYVVALEAEIEDGDDDDERLPQIVSQGSSGSSSGLYEFDSQTRTTPPPQSHGINKVSEAKSPQSVQSFSDHNEERPSTASPLPKQSKSVSGTNGTMKNVLSDMPCVSTTGVGPNGKRVDGFLYRYKKGEEVRIVCVCHGNFLTPAEFIKHAGGGDVENPLRHIVVSSSPFL